MNSPQLPTAPGPAASGATTLLWVDMKHGAGCDLLSGLMLKLCALHRIGSDEDISAAIAAIAPDVVCFDFADPSPADLNILQEIKLRHVSLPILMFSEQSSTELAIWALRARVWDYFIKPVCAGEVMRRLSILARLTADQRGQSRRSIYLPQRMQLTATTTPDSVSGHAATQAAVEFLKLHYDEKVTLECVARLCGMGPFEFSRAFKLDQGQTFRDFLITLRINAATALLCESGLSVLDISIRIGFNDPSHFARTFRRQTGVTPSRYRTRHKHKHGHAGVRRGRGDVTLPAEYPYQALADTLTANGL